jgi:hypothetical protein
MKITPAKTGMRAASLDAFRGLKLAFFAIFIQHLYPWVVSSRKITGLGLQL